MLDDHVDIILKQWAQERPDLDVSPMAITGRIARLSAFLRGEIQKTFSEFGLNHASFDLLATLLRSGPPYTLSPCELMNSAMVTSGTVTNRIDRLVESKLVTRTQSPADKRSYLITLTDKGYTLTNQTLESHVETLHRLTSNIPEQDRKALIDLLIKIIHSLSVE